jgi:hypothetical protein
VVCVLIRLPGMPSSDSELTGGVIACCRKRACLINSDLHRIDHDREGVRCAAGRAPSTAARRARAILQLSSRAVPAFLQRDSHLTQFWCSEIRSSAAPVMCPDL